MTKKKAFCVGINDYGHRSAPEMGLSNLNLKGCVNDAHDWANLLVRHYDFSVADVTLLTDMDATRANILKGIKDLLAGAKKGDVLVFTNSSHGFFTEDVSGDEEESEAVVVEGQYRKKGRYDEAICPYDYPRLIIDDELRELFDGIGAGVNLTVISDSCFSGTLSDSSFSKKKGTRKLSQRSREILLTGTTDHALSGDAHEQGRYNGFMTYHAIKAIRDAGYRLTYAELYEKMLDSIKNSNTKYKDQHPQLEASPQNKQLYVFTNEFKK
ncbi:MAG: caspase family protein [Actinomycetota bacterium]|nr:caspase family protein [Actinomycetota bacterium]